MKNIFNLGQYTYNTDPFKLDPHTLQRHKPDLPGNDLDRTQRAVDYCVERIYGSELPTNIEEIKKLHYNLLKDVQGVVDNSPLTLCSITGSPLFYLLSNHPEQISEDILLKTFQKLYPLMIEKLSSLSNYEQRYDFLNQWFKKVWGFFCEVHNTNNFEKSNLESIALNL